MWEKLATRINVSSDWRDFVLTLIKYGASLAVGLVAAYRTHEWQYVLAITLELWAIIFLSDVLYSWKPLAAQIINDILMLLYNIQVTLLIFANSYLSLIMLDNVDSIEDISGKAVIYILAVLLVLVISFLPISKLNVNAKISLVAFCVCYVGALGVGLFVSQSYSPLYAYVRIAMRHYSNVQREQAIREAGDTRADFYQKKVEGAQTRPSKLGATPNVILIFTEGLSQHIIDDERNIMPNVAKFQEESLTFSNYYNHTFATYRGLQGQLFSGFQQENYDPNGLISIQSILSDIGYQTVFINSEPHNPEFSQYLEDLGFDEVIGDSQANLEGKADSMSDKESYDLLLKTIEELSSSRDPYFAAIYTFGTHASFGSPNKKFEDGANDELNKFYDCDWWFGEFIDKLKEENLTKDILVIFTTDHASFSDFFYQEAFPEYFRVHGAVDEIPLMFWHDDVEVQSIDVDGRTSLCLAPTILDYLDISEPNYFLGESLFLEKNDSKEILTTFHFIDQTMSTNHDEITLYKASEEREIEKEIDAYYAAKLQ